MSSKFWTLLMFVALAASCVKAQTIPAPVGYVNDFAKVIPDSIRTGLEANLRAYSKTTSIEIAVVTVPSLQDYAIEDYSMKLAEQWKVGKKGLDNGLIILIAPQEHKWRIEVGYGLEAYITDADASEIGNGNFPEYFRRGDFGQGILKGVLAVQKKLGSVAWDMREANRKLEEQRQSEENERLAHNALTVLLVLGILALIGLIIGTVTRARRALQNKRADAVQAIHNLKYNTSRDISRTEKLRDEGFRNANDVLADLSGKVGDRLNKLTATPLNKCSEKELDSAIALAKSIDANVIEATRSLFKMEKDRDFVKEVSSNLESKIKAAQKVLQEAVSDLTTLKTEAPKKVWENLFDLQTVPEKIADARDLVAKAIVLISVKEQRFAEAADLASRAENSIESAMKGIESVRDIYDDWTQAKNKYGERLDKMSGSDRDKIQRQATDDGLMDWLVVAALLTAMDRTREEEEERENQIMFNNSRDNSSYESNSDSGGFGGFGGGSFGGGGSSGSW